MRIQVEEVGYDVLSQAKVLLARDVFIMIRAWRATTPEEAGP
jgi:hypothetical protein